MHTFNIQISKISLHTFFYIKIRFYVTDLWFNWQPMITHTETITLVKCLCHQRQLGAAFGVMLCLVCILICIQDLLVLYFVLYAY